MGTCLVQQLFRLKIGKELDQGIVDEVLFPMLRLMKHPSKELLQDIKLATDTLIITDYSRREARHFRVPTFTPIPDYWTYLSPWHGIQPGQRTSKVRRRKIRNVDWGTIDILNELRGLNYPQVGYKARSYVIEEPLDFEDAYISLAEDNSLPAPQRAYRRNNAVLIDSRSQFVNNFLDDVLITDKRLTWGVSTQWGILSVVESSQHGEVQTQVY
jgi:hypothetical protein